MKNTIVAYSKKKGLMILANAGIEFLEAGMAFLLAALKLVALLLPLIPVLVIDIGKFLILCYFEVMDLADRARYFFPDRARDARRALSAILEEKVRPGLQSTKKVILELKTAAGNFCRKAKAEAGFFFVRLLLWISIFCLGIWIRVVNFIKSVAESIRAGWAMKKELDEEFSEEEEAS